MTARDIPPLRMRLLGVIALVILLILYGYAGWTADKCHRSQDCGGYYGAKNTATSGTIPESADDRIADYTWWLAAFTLALVSTSLFQGYFLIRADRTSRIAADAARDAANIAIQQAGHMERYAIEAARLSAATEQANILTREAITSEQRAWLRPQVRLDGPFTYRESDGAGEFNIAVEIKNIGRTPATKVNLETAIIVQSIENPGPTIVDAQIKLAGKTKWSKSRTRQEIIFPGDSLDNAWIMFISKPEIDAATRHGTAMDVTFLGCVDYNFSLGNGHHQTWFAFEILRKTENGIDWLDLAAGDVPAESLYLSPSWVSEKHAD